MAKRVDHDATQEVSASMLVPDKRPPAKPPVSNAPKNDASMWMQAPVSADDFVSAPRKKPVAPGGGGRSVIVGLMAAAFVAVSAAGVYFAFIKDSPKSTASYGSPAAPGSAAPTPAVAATAADAAVATATPDAAVAAVAPDAGAPQLVGGLQVDAISAADPAVKKTKKRATTKKKPIKKKTATAPKRRK